MQHSAQKNQDIETSLREHLLAAQGNPQSSPGQDGPHPEMRPSASTSPHEHQIDPAISGTPYMNPPSESGGDDGIDGSRKGKRELSTSKRAAQNRAAQVNDSILSKLVKRLILKQRAFRQRKEGYIKQLEERVKESDALKESYRAIQAENYLLRDYIINLQSRLLESQGEYPQPPPTIELSNPRSAREAEVSAQHLQNQAAQAQVQAEAAEAQRRSQQHTTAAPSPSNAVNPLQHAPASSRDQPMIDADRGDEPRYAPVKPSDFTPANRHKNGESVDRSLHMRTAAQALAREMPSA
ncbi:MAG: hypothetical protein M1820_005571 [Bogoriella megaspora]|nr:MAG: hypothetical protein M1820_005571 [Bogoriella megaspora]